MNKYYIMGLCNIPNEDYAKERDKIYGEDHRRIFRDEYFLKNIRKYTYVYNVHHVFKKDETLEEVMYFGFPILCEQLSDGSFVDIITGIHYPDPQNRTKSGELILYPEEELTPTDVASRLTDLSEEDIVRYKQAIEKLTKLYRDYFSDVQKNEKRVMDTNYRNEEYIRQFRKKHGSIK